MTPSREELQWMVRGMAVQLRLRDWEFRLIEDRNQRDAAVTIEREQRTAVIRYNPIPGADMSEYIRHEVAHVLLADMDYLACNGRSIEIMEMYNMLEERVCNVLATALAEV